MYNVLCHPVGQYHITDISGGRKEMPNRMVVNGEHISFNPRKSEPCTVCCIWCIFQHQSVHNYTVQHSACSQPSVV
jgi:hypothetical protein